MCSTQVYLLLLLLGFSLATQHDNGQPHQGELDCLFYFVRRSGRVAYLASAPRMANISPLEHE